MKTSVFFLGLLLSGSAFALDKAIQDVHALCLAAQKGQSSSVSANAQMQADGSVKLISGGGKVGISFSKSEWDGVQQVLKEHQAANLADTRDCIEKMMPYFKSKPTATKAAPPARSTAKAVSDKKASSAPAKTDDTKTSTATPTAQQEGSNRQNIGTINANKVVNVNEMNGDIDMSDK